MFLPFGGHVGLFLVIVDSTTTIFTTCISFSNITYRFCGGHIGLPGGPGAERGRPSSRAARYYYIDYYIESYY